jgi:hypothetical protein
MCITTTLEIIVRIFFFLPAARPPTPHNLDGGRRHIASKDDKDEDTEEMIADTILIMSPRSRLMCITRPNGRYCCV